jgi:uncharacterized membrane protein YidH (DUF202 family)
LPGLQAERTQLAWDRTALSALGNGALLLVRDLHRGDSLRIAGAVVAAAVALLAAWLGRQRGEEIAHAARHRHVVTAGPAMIMVAVGVLALGVVDLVGFLTG